MKIITYGSLMDKDSLSKTLKRNVKIKKIKISGYKRIFNAPFGNYSFLNLIKYSRAKIEAAYFVISKKELCLFDKREKGSKITEIIPNYFVFIWPENKCKKLPALQSYIDVCISGAKKLNISFWQNTIKPKIIIDDRKRPLYKI